MTTRSAVWRLAALALVLSVGSEHVSAEEPIPPGPGTPWSPPAELIPVPDPPAHAEVPPEVLQPGFTVSLVQAVEVALANNNLTRETWLAARAAAADVGSKRAAFYPQLDLGVDVQYQKLSAVGGRFELRQTTYGPSLDLSYLLFDFGSRKAEVAEARQKLYAANWDHNAALQDVVLEVVSAYYQYLNAKALRDAAEADLRSFETNLGAANDRHEAGVATIADVLQARTQAARARLDFQRFDGQMKVIKGSLATAMGLPPDLPVEVGDLPADVPVGEVTRAVEKILEQALAQSPDLAAARARAAAADQHALKTRADRRPRVSLGANANRLEYTDGTAPSNNYSALLALRFPLFDGSRRRYEQAKAEAEAQAAHTRVTSLAQQVQLGVWSSYYDLATAAQRVETGKELLASATESAEVAGGRYRAGVGSILDLLAAQGELALARAEEVQARSDWFLALARLARDTGALAAADPQTALALIREEGDP